jgi:hypothetical protein
VGGGEPQGRRQGGDLLLYRAIKTFRSYELTPFRKD